MSEVAKRGFGDGASNKTPRGNAIGKPRIELVSVNLTVNGRVCPTTVEPRKRQTIHMTRLLPTLTGSAEIAFCG
jgi:hypothetical protein